MEQTPELRGSVLVKGAPVRLLPKTKFAADSPLEGAGFEPLVPLLQNANPGPLTTIGAPRLDQGYRNPAISDLFYGGGQMDRRGSGLSDMVSDLSRGVEFATDSPLDRDDSRGGALPGKGHRYGKVPPALRRETRLPRLARLPSRSQSMTRRLRRCAICETAR
jgi:hypothetical protein